MATKLKFGLLLPHFGEHGSVEKCIEGAKKAEAYGFDSVWVRDHLVFEPHGMEGSDNTHIEGLLMLSAIASVAKKLILGTGTVIAHRHPIHLAQCMAGLSTICDGQVIMGIGLGTFQHEFAAAGYPDTLEDRANLAKISVTIARMLWSGEKVSYEDRYFSFKDVELKPTPVKPIPVWYGGATPASCRRAVDYCDGWMPGRIPLASFHKCISYLHELCDKAGKPMVTTGAIPITSIAKDKETALSKVNVKGLINEGNKKPTWVKPASGTFSKLEDIEGLLLAGTPEDIVRVMRKYDEAGLNHVVYDLRFRYADWYEQVDFLGKEVLPALRA
ncbi:MAG: LLM class flavin-dependent oxidoreductase [Deltaproteobacteria bacterium]|nr:LLM class flavin-dependent oxidoreductase [Deltaproteobacteria bacterium]